MAMTRTVLNSFEHSTYISIDSLTHGSWFLSASRASTRALESRYVAQVMVRTSSGHRSTHPYMHSMKRHGTSSIEHSERLGYFSCMNNGSHKKVQLKDAHEAKVGTVMVSEVVTQSRANTTSARDVILGCYFDHDEALLHAGSVDGDPGVRKRLRTVIEYHGDDGRIIHAIVGEPLKESYVNQEQLRVAALAKLTPEERKALGV